jgi:hypothetical protein
MVTLALVAMCGLIGLAVDFGWAYFVKRAAQGAADAAAIAAAEEMRRMTGVSGPYPCLGGGGVCRDDSNPYVCAGSVTLDGADNLDNACLYARQNGFQDGGRQRVFISEGTASAPPTVTGVPLQYWATVRVTESVPQLFAAITGNPIAVVSARATAGLYQGRVRGSIILLNRNTDTASWGAGNPTGANLDVGGTSQVRAGGGILMASGCNGANCGGTYAGAVSGNSSSVTAPYTHIRDTGNYTTSGGATWTATPQNGYREGSEFQDPTRRKNQVPVVAGSEEICEVPGGVIAANPGETVNLGPGKYYAIAYDRQGNPYATGQPIQFSGNVKFNSSGQCFGGVAGPSNFSRYVFYGGIMKQNGQDTAWTFDPGEIIFAGATPPNQNSAGRVVDMDVGGGDFSITGPGPTSAGNVFVFTDPNYPGLGTPPARVAPILGNLKQGAVDFKSGGSGRASFTLDGLNAEGAGFPAELKPWENVVMWQDRRNSVTRYLPDGSYDCVAPYTDCGKSGGQQATDGVIADSPQLSIAAGAQTVIRGIIYQPRGSWAVLQAAPGMSAPLQLISGALKVQGNGTINMTPVTEGLPVSIVSLVE